jgi:hypothetical protein
MLTMSPLLDDDELTALLEKQAFSPSRWLAVSLLFSLAIFAISLYWCIQSIWQEKNTAPNAAWLEWHKGRLQPLANNQLKQCVSKWGSKRGLPPAIRVVIRESQNKDSNHHYWYMTWLGDTNSYNFSIDDPLAELCL